LPGSGILYDLGAHLVDQALQLFGTPDSMMADVFRQRDGANADDYFHLLLRYGRLRVILHASMFVLEPGPHYAVYGDRGSFVKYGMDPQEDQLRAGLHPGDANWGVDANERAGVLALADGSREEIVTERGAWESFYQGVTAALLDGAPAPVNAKDSRNVVALIESAALTK
jgi:scyllo-inositol 2-dehydrogenase (NADP+)